MLRSYPTGVAPMRRAFFIALLLMGSMPFASAAFIITGNPIVDPGWHQAGNSLANGNYVRGPGNFEYAIWQFQGGRVPAGSILTTMPNPWVAGERIIGIGGFFTPPLTAAQLGWPAITGAAQNSNVAANARIVAKFGIDSGSAGN